MNRGGLGRVTWEVDIWGKTCRRWIGLVVREFGEGIVIVKVFRGVFFVVFRESKKVRVVVEEGVGIGSDR